MVEPFGPTQPISQLWEARYKDAGAILCAGGADVIRKEAWPFYRTSSGVLCCELEEPKGPKRPSGWLRAVRALTFRLVFLAGVKWWCLRINEPLRIFAPAPKHPFSLCSLLYPSNGEGVTIDPHRSHAPA